MTTGWPTSGTYVALWTGQSLVWFFGNRQAEMKNISGGLETV